MKKAQTKNKLPVAKFDQVHEFLRAGQLFQITQKTLQISIAEYTTQQLELLHDILTDNNTVTTLDIDNNERNTNLDKSWQLIGDILQTNKSIENLFIHGRALKDEYIKPIFMALLQNKILKKLRIHNKPFTNQGYYYYYLSELLKVSQTLSHVTIQYEEHIIAEQSVKNLTEALKINKSLKTLVLRVSINKINILGEALLYNTTLRALTLQIKSEELTKEEMESFCTSIERNVGLATLTIDVPEIYTNRLLKCFAINSTVSNLGLTRYGNKLDLTDLDENWIRQIKGLTYVDGTHELLDSVLLENKRVVRQHKEDLKILLFNIARSTTAFDIFPIEIWLHIFTFLVYPGTYVGDLAEIIFPKAWTLDFSVKPSNDNKSKNKSNNNNNIMIRNNKDNNNSSFCALL